MNITGRVSEIKELERVSGQGKAALIALFGRRRIGKTFLANQFFSSRADVQLYVTGERKQPLKRQLENFQVALESSLYQGARISKLDSWRSAFEQLVAAIKLTLQSNKIKEIFIFLDELPWLATPRSDLLSALDYAWNTQLSKIPEVRLVVAGSAASWIINNIVKDTGGLHNRLSTQIRLLPFSFRETREYCLAKGINFTTSELIEIYQCLGGVAYYLDHLVGNESAAQNIDRLLFKPSALSGEFPILLQALFKNPKNHLKIITLLGKHPQGLLRKAVLKDTKLSSGGGLSEALEELEYAGFVVALRQYGGSKREVIYRLNDEYMIFYMHWLYKRDKASLENPSWLTLRKSPAYYAWAGFAFETLLLKHHQQLKKALGFADVECVVAPWQITSARSLKAGCQIDLVFDRADDVITLCEFKNSLSLSKLNNELGSKLKEKEDIFVANTKTKKRIQWAVVSSQKLDGCLGSSVRSLSIEEVMRE